jgi:glycosyltransferase involved in cell wall biosynthesis
VSERIRARCISLDPASASARVRLLDHREGLAGLGIDLELEGLPRGRRERRRAFARAGEADVVVLHRVLLGERDLVRLRREAAALVLDVDDAVHVRPGGRRPGRSLQRKFALTAQACDLVVVGSEHLRVELRERHPRVRLVPPAAPELAGAPRSRGDGPLRLVWTGSRATLPYLEALGPVLAALGEAVRLEVVADRAPRLPSGVAVRYTPWSLEAEVQALERAQVGLYPLPDDAWTRGKCAYKLHRYMQAGLASVASPLGAAPEVLAPPEAGLLAEDLAAWEAALRRLGDEPKLLEALSLRALGRARAVLRLAARTDSLAAVLREGAAIGRRRNAST